MKTTLVIADAVMEKVRQEAARTGSTISELVEAALRSFLNRKPGPRPVPELPVWHGGGFLVDVASREALDSLDDE